MNIIYFIMGFFAGTLVGISLMCFVQINKVKNI